MGGALLGCSGDDFFKNALSEDVNAVRKTKHQTA
jgi:hypothetical protein